MDLIMLTAIEVDFRGFIIVRSRYEAMSSYGCVCVCIQLISWQSSSSECSLVELVSYHNVICLACFTATSIERGENAKVLFGGEEEQKIICFLSIKKHD